MTAEDIALCVICREGILVLTSDPPCGTSVRSAEARGGPFGYQWGSAGRRPCVSIGRLEFLSNTCYAFPVRWNSFHGVERLPDDAGVRHTLMNTFYWSRSR